MSKHLLLSLMNVSKWPLMKTNCTRFPLLFRQLLPCCTSSCFCHHSPAEEAAQCCHPKRERRTLVIQRNSSHGVRCHRFTGPICGQQAGWVQYICSLVLKHCFSASCFQYDNTCFQDTKTVISQTLNVAWCCRSGWLSDRNPSPLRSVWPHVL